MAGRDRAVSQDSKILACWQVKLDSLLSCSVPEFIKLWTPLMPSRLRLTKPLWAPVIDKLSSILLPQQVPKLMATSSAWQLLKCTAQTRPAKASHVLTPQPCHGPLPAHVCI